MLCVTVEKILNPQFAHIRNSAFVLRRKFFYNIIFKFHPQMNNLPSEIWAQIFKHLPQKDLLNLTTVCKAFNEIIASNKLIKELRVNSKCDSSLLFLRRKYSKLVICDSNVSNYLTVLQTTADSISEVTLNNFSLPLNSIVLLLNLFKNVTKIKFYYTRLDDVEVIEREEGVATVATAVVHPLNGIKLEIYESDPKIFRILRQVSIKNLDIRLYGDSSYYDFTDFLPFMRNQMELKSFAISGIYESNLMYGNIPTGSYHLNEFNISNCDLEEWNYLETYLGGHVESLEKLVINNISSWDPSSIIKQCTQLKILELGEDVKINHIQDDIATVEALSFHLPNAHINKFPNVKKLYMQSATAEMNQLLNGQMRKVTELCVRYGTVEGINFGDVTKMTLINIDQPIEHEFFALHSMVENLSLENFFHLDDTLLEVIVQNLPNLKTFKIHGLNKLTSRAFQIIKTHCRHLQVLDTKIWTQKFTVINWKCLFENNIKIYTETFNF